MASPVTSVLNSKEMLPTPTCRFHNATVTDSAKETHRMVVLLLSVYLQAALALSPAFLSSILWKHLSKIISETLWVLRQARGPSQH